MNYIQYSYTLRAVLGFKNELGNYTRYYTCNLTLLTLNIIIIITN